MQENIVTFINGKITLRQIIVLVIAFIVILAVTKFLKGIIRTAATVIILCGAMGYYGVTAPVTLQNSSSLINGNGTETYQTIAKASDSIKFKNNTISVRIQDKWYSLDDITSVISYGDDIAVNVNGKVLQVDSPAVADLINSSSDKNILQKIFRK